MTVAGGVDPFMRAFDEEQAYTAGMLRSRTRTAGPGLGDGTYLALAHRSNALGLTAVRSWSRLELGTTIEVIR